MTKSINLSTGPINGAEVITVTNPTRLRACRGPHRLNYRANHLEVASTAMRLLAEASTTFARIKEAAVVMVHVCDWPRDDT
jgi:hypothetical protein